MRRGNKVSFETSGTLYSRTQSDMKLNCLFSNTPVASSSVSDALVTIYSAGQ